MGSNIQSTKSIPEKSVASSLRLESYQLNLLKPEENRLANLHFIISKELDSLVKLQTGLNYAKSRIENNLSIKTSLESSLLKLIESGRTSKDKYYDLNQIQITDWEMAYNTASKFMKARGQELTFDGSDLNQFDILAPLFLAKENRLKEAEGIDCSLDKDAEIVYGEDIINSLHDLINEIEEDLEEINSAFFDGKRNIQSVEDIETRYLDLDQLPSRIFEQLLAPINEYWLIVSKLLLDLANSSSPRPLYPN